MKRLLQILTVILVWQLMPSNEVLESVVHFAKSGHTAHSTAVPGPDHEPIGSEHACSGPFHTCVCHNTTDLVRVGSTGLLVSFGEHELEYWTTIGRVVVRPADIFRPPILLQS